MVPISDGARLDRTGCHRKWGRRDADVAVASQRRRRHRLKEWVSPAGAEFNLLPPVATGVAAGFAPGLISARAVAPVATGTAVGVVPTLRATVLAPVGGARRLV